MKLKLSLKMTNAAFTDDCEMPMQGREAARILRSLARQIEDKAEFSVGDSFVLYDANGNLVGTAFASVDLYDANGKVAA